MGATVTKKPGRNRLQHYLLTVPILGGYVHSYVICKGRCPSDRIVNHMLSFVPPEEQTIMTMVSMQTQLDADADAKKQVVDFLRDRFPQSKRNLDSVTDFHCSVWMTASSGPDVDWLLEIH